MEDLEVLSDDFVINSIPRQAAVNAANTFGYGHVISKDWLMAQFGLKEPKTGTRKDFETFAFSLLSHMDAFRDHLLKDHKMCLDSVRGEGYRIVPPRDQAGLAMARLQKSVSSEIRKAVMTLTHINESLLTTEERQHQSAQLGKVAALSAFSKEKLIGHK